MTTFYDFTPSTSGPFTFQPTLDGQVYNCVVTWNVFGARWYLNIYDLGGNLIVCTAMVGSPLDKDISLTKGYFTSTLVYRVQNNQIEISG